MNKKIILFLIFAAGLAVGFGGFYFIQNQKALSSDEASKIAINFIDKTVKEQDASLSASLLSAAEESGVYKIHLKIQEQEYDSFISKDGKYLFSAAFNLAEQQAGQENNLSSAVSLENLAKCITEKGAKFYGASWCSHCKSQKEMFGEAAAFLPYVECSTPDGESQLDVCKDNNITSYPTWEFSDGSRELGEVSLEKLSEKTGCQLPQ